MLSGEERFRTRDLPEARRREGLMSPKTRLAQTVLRPKTFPLAGTPRGDENVPPHKTLLRFCFFRLRLGLTAACAQGLFAAFGALSLAVCARDHINDDASAVLAARRAGAVILPQSAAFAADKPPGYERMMTPALAGFGAIDPHSYNHR